LIGMRRKKENVVERRYRLSRFDRRLCSFC
jgi:hypothetical protein